MVHPRAIARQRLSLLHRLDVALEKPMLVLGIVWLGLLVAQMIYGSLSWITWSTLTVWAFFLADFTLRLMLAPKKLAFLKKHWLVALSLVLPALSILRLARVLAMLPSWEVLIFRLLTGVNRSISVLGTTMRKRKMAYVLSLSVLVTFAGAAGMYALEPHSPGAIPSFTYALWWTAMMMTTMGSNYYPQTPGGQLLCFLLALFAFSIFGYVTAAIASYFVKSDASEPQPDAAGNDAVLKELRALRTEIAALRGAAAKNPASEPRTARGVAGRSSAW